MANIALSLSSVVNSQGKSEILMRCTISRTNRPRLKTNIFCRPDLFIDGEIYSDKKKDKREVDETTALINTLKSKVENIIEETIKAKQIGRFTEGISKEWIEKVLASCSSLDLMHVSFNEINDCLREKEKSEEEAKRIKLEEEQKINKKTIFEHILEYCELNGLSDKRDDMFRALARALFRYQTYKQRLQGNKNFTLDVELMSGDDVNEIRKYLHNEFKLSQDHPTIFGKICTLADKEIPVKKNNKLAYQKAIHERGITHVEGMLSKFHTIIKSLIKRRLISNDPFVGLSFQKQSSGDPTFLTKEERNALMKVDLNKRLSLIRDVFVFQCFVGCRYGDLAQLKRDNIVRIDNEPWLIYTPTKTQKHDENGSPTQCTIPLQPTAIDILQKYEGIEGNDYLLPVPKRTSYNDGIKEMLEVCGIDRKVEVIDSLTGKRIFRHIYEVSASHLARRTFVNTLYQEIADPSLIGKMSGHVEGSTAFQRYRKISTEQLSLIGKKMN